MTNAEYSHKVLQVRLKVDAGSVEFKADLLNISTRQGIKYMKD
jgi:hypothetical protein